MLKKLLVLGALALSSYNLQADPLKSTILYVGPYTDAPQSPDAVGGNLWASWSKNQIDQFSTTNNGFIIIPHGGYDRDFDYANYYYNVDSNVNTRSNPWQSNNTQYNYSLYISDIRKTVQSIYESRGTSSSVYISMPRYRNGKEGVNEAFYSDAAVRDFLIDLKANVMAVTGGTTNFWDNSVKGFYAVEETFRGCVKLNTPGYCIYNETFDGDFNYFMDVRSRINSSYAGKEFIWAPLYKVEQEDYHGNGVPFPYKKLSQMLKWQNANGTVFDRVLMQPGWANVDTNTSATSCVNCFDIVTERVQTQSINGIPAGNTRLGFVMEMKGSESNDNNQKYFDELGRFRFKLTPFSDSTDFTFYISDTKSLINDCINPFYIGSSYCSY